jgi:hypothetical protein
LFHQAQAWFQHEKDYLRQLIKVPTFWQLIHQVQVWLLNLEDFLQFGSHKILKKIQKNHGTQENYLK